MSKEGGEAPHCHRKDVPPGIRHPSDTGEIIVNANVNQRRVDENIFFRVWGPTHDGGNRDHDYADLLAEPRKQPVLMLPKVRLFFSVSPRYTASCDP